MNISRILSIAAVAAFASMGAQAAANSGDLYGTDFEAGFQSSLSRADVAAEAAAAVAHFKNFYVLPAAQPSVVTRAEVRSEAVIAVQAHQIATGNFS